MNFKIVFNVRYLGTSKLITLDENTDFLQIINQIIVKWPELCVLKFSAICVVGESNNICLDSQEDLESVKLICDVSRVRIVSVELSLLSNSRNNTEHMDMNAAQVDGFNINDDSVNVDNVPNQADSLLNQFPQEKRRFVNCSETTSLVNNKKLNMDVQTQGYTLLSDGWDRLLNFGPGLLVPGFAAEFRTALIKYSTKLGFKFNFVRNSPHYIHVRCKDAVSKRCDWFVKARFDILSSAFHVKSANLAHKCNLNSIVSSTAEKLSAQIIGDLMLPNAKRNSRLNGKDVIDAMKIGYGLDVPYSKARRAAELSKVKLYGDFTESYDHLKYYCQALKMTNPGTVVVMEANSKSNRFERLFIALYASVEGFQYCPPLLFVDGTFLRGPFKGIVLVAVAKDGNKGLFPVAFGVVSAENTSNWSWFLKNLKESVYYKKQIYYLSDRNTGLMAAFDEIFEQPVHFFCVYHLLANLKAKYCTGLKKEQRPLYVKLFKECAYEEDPDKFAIKIQEFKAMGGKKADEWLSELPYARWAISYSPHVARFSELTSNAAESFNAWILPARSLPITKMIDYIRAGLSKWFVQRRAQSKLWSGALVPSKEELWNKLSSMGVIWQVVMCPGSDYEVLSMPSTRVDLVSRVCSCHQWQTSGFPCCHAVVVIRQVRTNLHDDVEPYFLCSFYQQCYGKDINPVPETLVIELQNKPTLPKILSPLLSRPIGRPKGKKRVPSVGEWRKKKLQPTKCVKCGKLATHDEWTCGA